jgi:drug/metabolite transporter (DMT)-like permease
MKENELKGTILVLIAALISGISIVANKIFVTPAEIDPMLFTAIRAFLIGIGFMAILIYQNGFELKSLKKTDWKSLLVIGIVGGGIAFLLFFSGLKWTTASNAAFIQKTLPVFAVILSYLILREKITKHQLEAIILMFFGTGLVISGNFSVVGMVGDFMILAATILWAFENVISKYVMNKESNFTVSFARMFIGSIFLFMVAYLFGNLNNIFMISSQGWTNILISTLLLFGYVLTWYWGLKHVNLSKAAPLLLISPIITMILEYFWRGTIPGLTQFAGSLMILAGAYVVVRIKSEKRIDEL